MKIGGFDTQQLELKIKSRFLSRGISPEGVGLEMRADIARLKFEAAARIGERFFLMHPIDDGDTERVMVAKVDDMLDKVVEEVERVVSAFNSKFYVAPGA